MKRFLVALPGEDGELVLHAMKAWLRQNLDRFPEGFQVQGNTSHQLRNALKKLGWTVQELTEEVRLIPPDSPPPDVPDDGEDETTSSYFALENQLRDFLASNLPSINVQGKRLRVYEDPKGEEGVEYSTSVGRIDILAVDDGGDFYVFELKRARSPDRAIGQVARYMGYVQDTIGRGKRVYGLIVAQEIGTALRYAASVVPNVGLLEYEVVFNLRDAGAIRSNAGTAR